MNNDLSKVKVGDWIWTISSGWTKVNGVNREFFLAIQTTNDSYMINGRLRLADKYPSAFIEPPACFNAEPKPCEFKRGQRVITKRADGSENRRYFSHEKNGTFYCFIDGKDEWSSQGDVCGWNNCKAWEEVVR